MSRETTPEENVAIVQRMIDYVVTDRMERLPEVLADPFRWHYTYEDRDPVVPLDEIIAKHERYRRGFGEDFHSRLLDVVAAGDRVVGRYSEGGTMVGPLLGFAPSTKPVIFSGICIWRIEDGLITDEWFYSNLRDTLANAPR
ncbi:ester cyclase [Pseudonocardia pini]|uniref:ester cyclase n=1 Tax=Pseudonocardia pini TaxID=2758030 RepID=UPI0015F07D9F|nr:ester cyclase [Pseudonocardia pini]